MVSGCPNLRNVFNAFAHEREAKKLNKDQNLNMHQKQQALLSLKIKIG
jgi:hypothetical protein